MFEFTILNVYESQGQLRVETECKYGKDNIGLNLSSQYINIDTGEPKFIEQSRKLLQMKYDSGLKKEMFKELKGKKFRTKEE